MKDIKLRLSVKQFKKMLKEEVVQQQQQPIKTLGPGGPGVGSFLMSIKSGIGVIVFKVKDIRDDQTADLVSEELGEERIAVPQKGWKSFKNKDGAVIYFNTTDATWH